MITENSLIDDLDLDRRTLNALHGGGVYGLDTLMNSSRTSIASIPGIGRRALDNIDTALSVYGLSLPEAP